ncbi:MAG: Rab family GTPase [Candidatus Lokiarchaeia archaeon]
MGAPVNIKLAILGEGAVGKTSVVKSFLGEEIPDRYLPTIGNETHKKDYIIKKTENVIRVSLWDFGGQRGFNPFNPTLYANIDIALFVFDLTRPKETLKNIKSEFLEHVNRYSEEVLTLYVGNKLDLISSDDQVKTSIKDFLAKKDHVILMSAKTRENVDKCFELVIHTFLRKAEIMYPDVVFSDTAKGFLTLIGTNEKELKERLVNLTNIDTVFQKIKPKPKTKKKVVDEKKDKDLKYYEFLKQELQKNENQKNDVFDQFLINISELDKTINHMKKTQVKSVQNTIDNLKELLIAAKIDFEKNNDFIRKLNAEEFELVKIISKTREEQSKQVKKVNQLEKKEIKKKVEPQINLYKIYEEENPGKKAIWRSKETKDFLAWKKKYGQIMKISK